MCCHGSLSILKLNLLCKTMMAKVVIAWLVVVAATASAFTPSTFARRSARDVAILRMGLFDFEPFRGSGSGKEKLDEQWEAQQAILRERRGHNDKDALKKKYSAKKADEPATTKDRSETPAEQKPDAKGFFWEK